MGEGHQNQNETGIGLEAEVERLRRELDNAGYERQRLMLLLQAEPDRLKLEETQALLQAAEMARQSSEERNLELSRLLSQASKRQAELEQDSLEQQNQTHQQLQELQALHQTLQNERDTLFAKAEQNNPTEMITRLHGQLKDLHSNSKQKLETLGDELKRRHTLWSQETQQRTELERSFAAQAESYQKQIAQLQSQIRDLKSDVEDHQHALETTEDQLSWMEGEIEDREEIIESLRQQLSAYLEGLRKAQSKLNEAGQALQQRNSLLKKVAEERMRLASQARAWEASCHKTEDEKKALALQLETLTTRVEDLDWELEETRVSLDDSQHQVASLQDQLRLQVPQAHQMLREAQARIAQLEGATSAAGVARPDAAPRDTSPRGGRADESQAVVHSFSSHPASDHVQTALQQDFPGSVAEATSGFPSTEPDGPESHDAHVVHPPDAEPTESPSNLHASPDGSSTETAPTPEAGSEPHNHQAEVSTPPGDDLALTAEAVAPSQQVGTDEATAPGPEGKAEAERSSAAAVAASFQEPTDADEHSHPAARSDEAFADPSQAHPESNQESAPPSQPQERSGGAAGDLLTESELSSPDSADDSTGQGKDQANSPSPLSAEGDSSTQREDENDPSSPATADGDSSTQPKIEVEPSSAPAADGDSSAQPKDEVDPSSAPAADDDSSAQLEDEVDPSSPAAADGDSSTPRKDEVDLRSPQSADA